ncbi:DUF4180 domain-containing protein [Kutzneria buriramensis]|uniref:Uncharacterized protein DUF4180 n=1 Tax=Kutzneria buriramensis TaxID=1045776 RepID=A0A3E0H099_9PSEU|nr:DUF4180 domain-containing protein [Kutzneria buriramensis]REH36238.1 uncharacterized protein DUF4180 [Kutzneria buriramensis]
MADVVTDIGDTKAYLLAPDGPKVASEQDAVDIIGQLWGQPVALVAIPVERFADGVFDLKTTLLGHFTQKFIGYGKRLAVLGDLGEHLAASESLRAYVRESNRGRHIWFAASIDEVAARLS